LTSQHPLRERFWAQLMLALYRSDHQAEALAAFRTVNGLLVDELGVDPGPALQLLHEQILLASPELRLPRRSRATVPKQLPAHIPQFVGRADELALLSSLLDDKTADSRPVVISAIKGNGGIGKTALALYWANQVAHRFPDGQLYVNLRGFDPVAEPVSVADAVRGFLEALGVPTDGLPSAEAAQVALYRSLVADRRMLVLLDNARNAEQVRPLLPGGTTCLALVTSRDQLGGLVVQEGAQPITLGVLEPEDAMLLLERRLGVRRVAAEPGAAKELIELCAGLPLALAIMAARAAINRDFTLRELVAELADERGRLAALYVDDAAGSVRAVFSWSYRGLSGSAAALFRLMSVHLGPDISLPAAASLAGLPVHETREALDELARFHLVVQHAPNRFAFHDLLRLYATEKAREEVGEDEIAVAVRRVLDFYLYAIDRADRSMRDSRTALELPPLSEGVRPHSFGSYESAVAWCDLEIENLVAAMELAADSGHHVHAWQIPTALWAYMHLRQNATTWIKSNEIALVAARHIGDRYAEAVVLHTLGHLYQVQGRVDEALRSSFGALRIREEIGHQHGVGATLDQLAHTHAAAKRFDEACVLHRRAIDARRVVGNPTGIATALNNYAMTLIEIGEYEEARGAVVEGIDLAHQAGFKDMIAASTDTLGLIYLGLGRYGEAIDTFKQVLALPHEFVAANVQAETFENIANAYSLNGESELSNEYLRRALEIFERLGGHRAEVVRERLAGRGGVTST
jgi:tetratricopeptide (TPR) repeat protein